jgi:hypothetical protein
MSTTKLLLIVAATIAVQIAPGGAAQLTLNCRATERTGSYVQEWQDVDRIVVDTEKPEIQFQVARTIGTDNQRDWKFKNEQSSSGEDKLAVGAVSEAIRSAGIRSGTPYAIWIETSLVRYVSLSRLGISSIMFECRP